MDMEEFYENFDKLSISNNKNKEIIMLQKHFRSFQDIINQIPSEYVSIIFKGYLNELI
jgi:hypothetical protein